MGDAKQLLKLRSSHWCAQVATHTVEGLAARGAFCWPSKSRQWRTRRGQ